MHYWNTVLSEVANKNNRTQPFLFTHYGRLSDLDESDTQDEIQRDPRDLRTYYMGDQFPEIYLTKREAESVFWLVQELTVAEAAIKMGLSRRTVEFYVRNLKVKLGCKNKRAMIDTIMQTTLLQQLEQDGMKIVRH